MKPTKQKSRAVDSANLRQRKRDAGLVLFPSTWMKAETKAKIVLLINSEV